MAVTIVRPTKFFRSAVGEVTPNNLGQLKVLLEREMPQGFSNDIDGFCKESLNADELSKLVYFNDMPVGALVCRKDVDPKEVTGKHAKNAQPPQHKLTVLALCVLKPYRELGLEALLVESVVAAATEKTKSIEFSVAAIASDEKQISQVLVDAGFSLKNDSWSK